MVLVYSHMAKVIWKVTRLSLQTIAGTDLDVKVVKAHQSLYETSFSFFFILVLLKADRNY